VADSDGVVVVPARVASPALEAAEELERIEAVLVGDGWPVFCHGHRALAELARSLDG